jgi:DNA repair protein RecN (Recombination protein N)
VLQALAIRDVVIIDRLDLAFGGELGVLTGETGAGKSILLDALGLATGGRADKGLVRKGAERCQVTAVFAVGDDHPARAMLREAGIEAEDETLVLRRVVGSDGKSRAFVDDQPVTTTLLRALGRELIEVHGQGDQQGLAARTVQRDLLDAYGGHEKLRAATAAAQREVAAASADRDRLEAEVAAAAREEDYLRHRLAELDDLAPAIGEEEELADKRARLLARGKLQGAVAEALTALREAGGARDHLVRAERALERVAEQADGLFEASLQALERARVELDESEAALDDAAAAVSAEGEDLESLENRLFALKDMARKHRTTADGLVELAAETRRLLDGLEHSGEALTVARKRLEAAETARRGAVMRLREARRAAGARLAEAVARELPPLKLDRVRFEVEIEPLAEDEWTATGGERVQFLVATNPGQSPGPLGKIASGGELARIMLALKVVLARLGTVDTLIFDEIDAGIGGATADAVGERLARLGRERQVLVVTHAPQVAARASHHLRVAKTGAVDAVGVEVEALEAAAREEEIARMLAGAQVTAAARAAAQSLLATEAEG